MVLIVSKGEIYGLFRHERNYQRHFEICNINCCNIIRNYVFIFASANYWNIVSALKNGENTIVLYDIAGNQTEMKFTYDKTLNAPTY